MGKRVVEEASLVSVADAIRDRAGTTEKLVFPEGFESAVEGIPDLLEMKMTNKTLQEYRNESITDMYRTGLSGYSGLKGLYLPNLVTIGDYGLQAVGCIKLDFPKLQHIGIGAFQWSSLETLILRSNQVCVLAGIDAFNSCPIGNCTGYIYVPKALVDSYASATNWSTYASQFRAIEDYPDITGG